MKKIFVVFSVLAIFLTGHISSACEVCNESDESSPQDAAIFLKTKTLKWEQVDPKLGARSPEFTFLHVDPETRATQLMIRIPKNFHVPKHWHNANEARTIVKGGFIVECNGKREEMKEGDFSYIPAKTIQEEWTKPGEETVLFISADRGWDVNWVDGPPTGEKWSRGLFSRKSP